MFRDAVESFTEFGYQWAGISGLAKATDDLGAAVINGTVGRNFSGPSPGRADNIIGVGPTTTAAFGDYYFQSCYDIQDYYHAVENDRFPIIKGYVLDAEDRIRRNVIFDFQCQQKTDLDQLSNRYNLDAEAFFSPELADLKYFIKDQLVEIDGPVVRLTPLGRYFVPQMCRVFDGFLRENSKYEIHGP